MSERGAGTRQRLVDTALRLFREDGYQATTMRRIAAEAGVSLGNAYYYFASKDDLVHELYLTVQREHRELAGPRLRRGATLTENLRVALHAGIDVMSPYHDFGSSFLAVALPPSARSSPFSADSADARQQAISLLREVVTSSRGRPSGVLLERLPTLLWLAYLGITLHWVTDYSPGQVRTRQLIDGVTPIVSRLVRPGPAAGRPAPGDRHRPGDGPGHRPGRGCGGDPVSPLRTAVVAGASGYVGQHLRRALDAEGIRVRTIGRGAGADARWGDDRGLTAVLDGADLLVNLAGRSVSCRYSKRNADAILSSRTETTAALGRALARADDPPALWVNASTGTIYRDARDRPQDEATGELGTGFSVAVARAWEHELFAAPAPIRKVALRMAIVLGSGGGALNPFIDLARTGFGGRMGSGTQVFSWVHVDDVVRAILHLHAVPAIAGPVNVATPHPVRNAELMAAVRATFGRSHGLPLPAGLLELGARVIRTETELVLKSRWVHPGVLLDSGFSFAYPLLPEALAAIAAGRRAACCR